MAKDNDGEFTLINCTEGIISECPLKLYTCHDNSTVQQVPTNTPITLTDVKCVACIHPSSTAFEVKTMSVSTFRETGERLGGALQMF